MSVRRYLVVASVLVLGVFASAQEVMQVAQEMPGFKAAMVYQDLGAGESVNAFNGGLTVVHRASVGLPGPMGSELRPARVYNSKNASDGYHDTFADLTVGVPHGPLGFGWTLGFGRVHVRLGMYRVPDLVSLDYYDPAPETHYTVTYFFQDESGAEHQLFSAQGLQAWTPQDPEPQAHWYVTNDGSYIRARYQRTSGLWTLYFPDGSIRVAGGPEGRARIPVMTHRAPAVDPRLPNPWIVTNPFSNGWYVTALRDRAGNETTVSYLPFSEGGWLPGSIERVVDPLGRTVEFGYDEQTHLLDSVTFPGGRTESYSYTSVQGNVGRGFETWPALARVTDPVGLQTVYVYQPVEQPTPVPGTWRGLLSAIHYPTGAVSHYRYGWSTYSRYRLWDKVQYRVQHNDSGIENWSLGVVAHTVEAGPQAGAPPARLTWSWERRVNSKPYLVALGRTDFIKMVIARDPLGAEQVQYFTAEDGTNVRDLEYPPGTEVFQTRRRPGEPPLDPLALNAIASPADFDPWAGVVSWTKTSWEWGGGDASLCAVVGQGPDAQPGPQPARHGNLRRSDEEVGERQPQGPVHWRRRTQNLGWDGFGHYAVTTTTDGTDFLQASTGKLAAAEYAAPESLPTFTPVPDAWTVDGILYRTDLALGIYSGMFDALPTVFETDPGHGQVPVPSRVIFSGEFGAVSHDYWPLTGLLKGQCSFVGVRTTLSYSFTSSRVEGTLVPGAGDKRLAVTQDAQGNVARLVYSGGDSDATYGFNFAWTGGAVSRMWRDGSPYGDEFLRGIDAATGRILSHRDPNQLVSAFTYDAIGRLTSITPPGGEYPTSLVYSQDTSTRGGVDWTTGHDILFYRGPAGYTPSVMDDRSGMDEGALYQHFLFDDLGRLVVTRSAHPGGYLTETLTAYDPLGGTLFTSLPYRRDQPPPGGILDWAPWLTTPGDVFVSTLPLNPGQAPPVSPYGSVTTVFEGALWPTAQEPSLGQLVAGPRDPFDRPVWAFGPDGTRTRTTYSGLDSAVTLFGIQGRDGEGNPLALDSTTWSRKDLWGRLVRVEPPVGTAAAYTYNGLDQLLEVDLSGQKRSFTYDALGRIRTARNPENGLTENLGYDCIGNLLGVRDANGRAGAYTFAYTYDALGRRTLTEQVAGDGSRKTLAAVTYDLWGGATVGASLGKVVGSSASATLQDGTAVSAIERLEYDASRGRVKRVTQGTDAGGAWAEYAFSLSYDAYGLVLEQALPGGSGTLVNRYAHGQQVGRAFSDEDPAVALLSGLSYTPAGTLATVEFGVGLSQRTGFDLYERPAGFSLSDAAGASLWGNGSFAGEAYQYDGAGNIASIGAGPGLRDEFAYDALSRLTRAVVHRRGGPHDFRYTYDSWGNLTARAEVVPQGLGATDLRSYLTAVRGLDPLEAEAHARAVTFQAPVSMGADGLPDNRVATVTRGAGSGFAPLGPLVQRYDDNGNLLDDGGFLYEYDALDRQVAVSDRATGALLAEYVYLASGERVAVRLYEGVGEFTGFTQHLREGAAVLWEVDAVSGRAKSYVYAGGRMAATREVWRECLVPRALAEAPATPTLLGPTVEEAGGAPQVTFGLSSVPPQARSVEVRLVREGEASATVARVERPEGGWCEGIPVTFPGLVDGAEYQAGMTLYLAVEGAPAVKPAPWLVERLRLKVAQGRMAAWTARRLKVEAGVASEEVAAGWADLAPEGAGDYTAHVHQEGGATAVLNEPTTHGDLRVPEGGTSAVTFAPQDGAAVSLATPSGGLPARGEPRPLECTLHFARTFYGVDHIGTVRYTRTVDEAGNVLAETTHDYEPFGVELPGQDACGNTHRFTGHERDAETGNDYMHYRFYTAGTGRFQKPDSLYDGAAQNPQGWNLYSYVKGNPVNFNDPTGHWGSKFHEALTGVALLVYGYSSEEAAVAAKANSGMDTGWKNPFVARYNRWKYHAFRKSGESRESATERTLNANQVSEGMSLVEFGETTHSRQDTEPHSFWGSLFGHLFDLTDTDSPKKHRKAAADSFEDTLNQAGNLIESRQAAPERMAAAGTLMALVDSGVVQVVEKKGRMVLKVGKKATEQERAQAEEAFALLTSPVASTEPESPNNAGSQP